jgi:hypothetical protein
MDVMQEITNAIDLGTLKCRVVVNSADPNRLFAIELIGTISPLGCDEHMDVVISMGDVTEGIEDRLYVLATQTQSAASLGHSAFRYQSSLGQLPEANVGLSHWTPIAHIPQDLFVLPRRGLRSLCFYVTVLNAGTRDILSQATCVCDYHNPGDGYLDIKEKRQTIRLWSLALAYAVCGITRRPSRSQVVLIRQWILPGVILHRVGLWQRLQLHVALFFLGRAARACRQVSLHEICTHITHMSPLSERYTILGLCLRLAATKAHVCKLECARLWEYAKWLEVDPDRFRTMIEKTLPIYRYAHDDSQCLLGITADMSREHILQHLNREYAKWNARVTHTDRTIQQQAHAMLRLIAETRSVYT